MKTAKQAIESGKVFSENDRNSKLTARLEKVEAVDGKVVANLVRQSLQIGYVEGYTERLREESKEHRDAIKRIFDETLTKGI